MEEALKAATHPHDFKLLVAAEGQRSTSVDQIYSRGPLPERTAATRRNGEDAGKRARAGSSAPRFNS